VSIPFVSLRRLSAPLFALASLAPLAATDTATAAKRVVTRLGDGIYEISHPDAPDGFPQSNTTVIIGERGVLVVDTCLLPSTAREDIADIRNWTGGKPVTHVVNTHWHFDHTLGNAEYAAAFPGVQIIAQTATAKIMGDFNQGAVDRYPQRAERFRKMLASGKDRDGKPLTDTERKELQQALDGLAPVVAEIKNAKQALPNLVFESSLHMDLGNRPVDIRFLGRGNTAGDTIVYLPREKLLCTGDLLDYPLPYLFGGIPTEEAVTLTKMAQLDASTIVPGHGDVLHDKSYLELVIAFLNAVNAAVEKEINQGRTIDETAEALPKDVDAASWKQKFAGSSAEVGEGFDGVFNSLVKSSYNLIKAR
jgi:glyoxylase-like metal-dependent hydrolase (beta-lactamase superfamily II)